MERNLYTYNKVCPRCTRIVPSRIIKSGLFKYVWECENKHHFERPTYFLPIGSIFLAICGSSIMGDIVSTDMPDADISGIHSTDMTGADTPHDITINTSSHDYHDIYPHHTADGHPYLADAMEG